MPQREYLHDLVDIISAYPNLLDVLDIVWEEWSCCMVQVYARKLRGTQFVLERLKKGLTYTCTTVSIKGYRSNLR